MTLDAVGGPIAAGLVPRTDVDFDTLAKHLRPLGNSTRLRLLHYLTSPRYLEEVASKLQMSRQGARKHLDELVKLGVVRKRLGRRDFGPVTEYVLNNQRLFLLHTEFAKLGSLKPSRDLDEVVGTIDHTATTGVRGTPNLREPQLVIVRGLDEGRAFELADQPGRTWRIGRAKESEIRLDYDTFLSNRHAEVRRETRGFILVDAFSRNGTYLNWRRLERGDSTPLESGDILGVGKSILVLRLPPRA